ncbi:MAG: precorrin-8X methylmutase [Firmicutes bacterium]|nr:precorrin-8X methylmutase [Bacillota bacterium]
MINIMNPKDVEKRSFEIIDEVLGDRKFKPQNEVVIKRVIHTTADFDYADNLVFSAHAVEQGMEALREGCHIVTDTHLVKESINKRALAALGGDVHCFISDKDVVAEAKERGVTRAIVAMERAIDLYNRGIPIMFAIGNAPTALMRIRVLFDEGRLYPKLVVGVPVGFVNVAESKELIISSAMPHIVARGMKGGSNVAASICNAMLYQIMR